MRGRADWGGDRRPAASQTQAPTAAIPLLTTQFGLERLAPGAISAQSDFVLDDSLSITVEVIANIGGLAVSIVGPGGEVVDENTVFGFGGEFGLNRVYLTLRRVAAIEIVFEEETHGPIGDGDTITVAVITAIPNEPEVGNDIVVAIPSGLGQGSFAAKTSNLATFDGSEGRNHISVLN